MVKTTFDDHFEILPATVADLDDVCRIFCESLQHDSLNIAINGKLSFEDRVTHIRESTYAPKFADPAFIWVKAVERSSGTMVGWACMRMAMPDPLELKSKNANIELEGLNKTVLHYLIHNVNGALLQESDYDKEKHFLRSGLHVHPSYQRRGIASRLSQAFNEIADRERRITFVKTRPAATKFFTSEGGWVKINEIPLPYRDLSVDIESDIMSAFRRVPHGVA